MLIVNRLRSIAPPVVPGKPEWTWMRFTVNGQPCRSGSYCTQNINKDIWSCPVEHGDWDYCCRPDHKCGYSEGTSYPWLVERSEGQRILLLSIKTLSRRLLNSRKVQFHSQSKKSRCSTYQSITSGLNDFNIFTLHVFRFVYYFKHVIFSFISY